MKNQIVFYFLILLFSTFYISFSNSQTTQEYDCLANIYTKFNLSVNHPKNATGGYSNICTHSGVTCSNGVVIVITISAFNEYPPSSAILTPNELLCLPNLIYIQLERIKVNTDFIFTKFGNANTLNMLQVPKGGIDINKIDRPFPPYNVYFLACDEFNNTILNSSYVNNVKNFYLQGSFVTFNINEGTNFTYLGLLSLWSLNVPDLSSYQSINSVYLTLRGDYDKSTVTNYATIRASSITISFFDGPAIPSIIETNRMVNYVTIYSQTFNKPSGLIDMSTGYNLRQVRMTNVGADFNVNGEFPIMFSSSATDVAFNGGSWKTIPAFANVSTGSLAITSSGLTVFPAVYAGSAKVLDFSNNVLTGTIDRSYCGSELIVSNNKLTGTIPTCYTCYFGFPISSLGSWSKTSFYNRFSNNLFTNYVSNPGACTTFAPQMRVNDALSGFIISGIDIGYEATPYKFNGTYSCPNALGIVNGEFNCIISNNFLKGVRYASILNTWHNKNYTFSLISSPPDATTVSISTNTLTIDGTYFSSYLGQSIQTVKVANVNCTISSTEFFKIVCTTDSSIPSSASASQLLTIATANETKKFYIQTSNGHKNTKVCPNDCSTNSRGICDLSTGTCVCNQGFRGSDCSEIPCPTLNSLECNGSPNVCNTTSGVCKCSGRNFGSACGSIQCVVPNCSNFGTCDTTVGTCSCDSSHQGSDCSLPLIQCPTFNSLTCNGGSNQCNNQTGICSCDSSHQGKDCSLPLIQCPTVNFLPCNGGSNQCNNQTGTCSCDSSHQGKDCSLPLIQCPTFNSLACNGGLNSCNNQTGICSCDSSHQGKDCSLPLVQCPTFNSLTCNGGSNQCNNQTGICSCNSSHQGKDCSLPLIQCPTVNSFPCNGGSNQCNNQTGTCSCDSSHQGSDCSLPLIQCPTFNSLACNGGSNSCNNQTGTCSCDSSHQGKDCSLPLIQCPTFNSLTCNGGSNQCNNQTGTCSCDSSHQGKDCSLPLIQCPTVNSLPCNGGSNQCNNQTGICSCDSSHQGSDCSLPLIQCPTFNSLSCNGGSNSCNNQTGTCSCDSSHQGKDCSLPLIQCPTVNSLSCNGGSNQCNNQTGTCSCDSSHQGSDCSLPLIQCPDVNSLPCNGGSNQCNNQTGTCSCDSSHQGSDCSLPLTQCPTFNSLTCNGGSNQCNDQNGTCSCDSSHQGSDCSLPLIQCPAVNSLSCNGGSNQCNNQTGTCSCDSSHQGSDCSLPLIPCPTFNSLTCNGGSNSCDDQTGTCSCDSSHQGNDCSLPLIQCPTFNSLTCNGGSNQCNNQTGTCSCDSSHQGGDCSSPFIECLNNCSGNGICDTYKGKCQCTPGKFIGEDCSIIYHYVTSVKPSTTKGGLASFYGVFGKVHDSLTIKIGGLDCKIGIDQVSDDQIDCIAPAGTGIKSINVTQNGVTYFKNNFYKYQSIETVLQCPKDCSGANNGICNTTTGQCTCINGYGSHDCSEQSNNNNNNSNGGSDSDSELPPSVIVVDPGKTNITNGETNFLIYIKSVSEIDYEGNILKTFNLNNVWEKVNSTDSNTYIYKQKLENTDCIVESKIEEITDKNGKLFSFADVDFKVESGSVKFSISVSNYTYVSNLNNLQIELVSETSQLVQDDDNCNEVDTSLDTSNFNSESNLNYIKISKNNKVLSGRFINKVVSDGKVTFLDSIATKSTSDSILITLNLPHCTSQCLIDPDFSVLLSSDFKSKCGEKDDKKSYVIPVAVVASVAGVASIGATSFIIYKKKFIENPLKKKLSRASQN
ncbi:hypothetical protein ACTFIY_008247 [Dictyostelium cf. discoideum]